MLLALEGLDGCGKTTLQKSLGAALESQGARVLLTSDLAGTALGRRVRETFLDPQISMHKHSAMLFLTAARMENYESRILPALEQGYCVIADRGVDSTSAYQVSGEGADADLFASACEQVLPVAADMVLLLDIPVDLSLERARLRGETDKIERRGSDFFERVREGFLERAKLPGRHVIDASQPMDKVLNDALRLVLPVALGFQPVNACVAGHVHQHKHAQAV